MLPKEYELLALSNQMTNLTKNKTSQTAPARI